MIDQLVVNGVPRVTGGGAAELLQRRARTYLGPEVVFPAMPDPPPGFVTRIRRRAGVGHRAVPQGSVILG